MAATRALPQISLFAVMTKKLDRALANSPAASLDADRVQARVERRERHETGAPLRSRGRTGMGNGGRRRGCPARGSGVRRMRAFLYGGRQVLRRRLHDAQPGCSRMISFRRARETERRTSMSSRPDPAPERRGHPGMDSRGLRPAPGRSRRCDPAVLEAVGRVQPTRPAAAGQPEGADRLPPFRRSVVRGIRATGRATMPGWRGCCARPWRGESCW